MIIELINPLYQPLLLNLEEGTSPQFVFSRRILLTNKHSALKSTCYPFC